MENYFELLKDSTKKLLDLNHEQKLKNELLTKAPPVLWFGDNLTEKEKIVTIGANPSREEFLSDNKSKAQKKLESGQSLKYLEEPLNRFKVLGKYQDWKDILYDTTLQEEIIRSYNNYFKKNPYKWFGKKATSNDLSYNVEGFINALDASYYENEKKYQCLHVDLIPFPTISDFTSILIESENYIFKEGWAQEFLNKLISKINPRTIIVFGRTNLDYFLKFMEISNIGKEQSFETFTENGYKSSTKYWLFKYKTFNVVGLSVNLGNPKGFSKETLNKFGKVINRRIITFNN